MPGVQDIGLQSMYALLLLWLLQSSIYLRSGILTDSWYRSDSDLATAADPALFDTTGLLPETPMLKIPAWICIERSPQSAFIPVPD